MSEQRMSENVVTPAVSVRNLWKVFGPKAETIPGSALAELSAAELKEQADCVAAVRDV